MSALPVLFYDGDCGLCNRAVRFVLRHERNVCASFASTQSAVCSEMLSPYIEMKLVESSLVLLEGDRVYVKSAAVFRLAVLMGGWPEWLAVFSLLPTAFTDALYDLVARNRRRLFGKSTDCALMPGVDQRRFIDRDIFTRV
ncbi:MAG: DUF393 domain-containing protein [Bacteroidetes bacterium]|nr:DUF393 domain-containing protein [Bacteroidales bacterium]MBU1010147.1 DUF393 domain-containing protein [Bacteroidota bacterium]